MQAELDKNHNPKSVAALYRQLECAHRHTTIKNMRNGSAIIICKACGLVVKINTSEKSRLNTRNQHPDGAV